LNYSERGTQRTGNRFYGLLVHHGSPGCEKWFPSSMLTGLESWLEGIGNHQE
jgi:hypothetical protein